MAKEEGTETPEVPAGTPPVETTAETPAETPAVPAATPPPVEKPAQTPAAPVDPAGLTVEQLQAEIAKRDQEIVAIKQEKIDLHNSQALTDAETKRLQAAMQAAIEARTALDVEIGRRPVVAAEELAAQQSAAQTATSEAQAMAVQLKEERGKRVKSEVILREFPDLAAYEEVISPHEDPEAIRKACRAIRAANERVLQTQRQVMATGEPPSQPATPPRQEIDATTISPDRIAAYLNEGRKISMEEYERRRQMTIAQLDELRGK